VDHVVVESSTWCNSIGMIIGGSGRGERHHLIVFSRSFRQDGRRRPVVEGARSYVSPCARRL